MMNEVIGKEPGREAEWSVKGKRLSVLRVVILLPSTRSALNGSLRYAPLTAAPRGSEGSEMSET